MMGLEAAEANGSEAELVRPRAPARAYARAASGDETSSSIVDVERPIDGENANWIPILDRD